MAGMFLLSERQMARISTIPMGRMGSPEKIAKAALFLDVDDFSFVTALNYLATAAGDRSDTLRTCLAIGCFTHMTAFE
jgi:NAD(P)-dependent dehydrogenase (short-subunit alcohol dehydrogenase family)